MKPTISLKNILTYPWYPWLLLVYFVLYLYSENLSIVRDREVLLVLAAGLGMITLLWRIICLRVRDVFKSAAVVGSICIGVLIYGHLWNLMPYDYLGKGIYLADLILLPAIVGTITLITWRILPQNSSLAAKMTVPLNLGLLTISMVPLYEIVQYHWFRQTTEIVVATQVNLPPKITDSPEYPDIYYIILDAYSSNAHLLRDFGYDNSDFTDALEARGFFVAAESTSNYGGTLASLPSTLNMRYLSQQDRQGNPSLDLVYVRQLMADNLVAQKLQAMGYTYIYVLSGFSPPSSIADVNIDFFTSGATEFSLRNATPLPDCPGECYQRSFVNFFLRTTMVRPLVPSYASTNVYRWSHPNRALEIWRETPEIAERDAATFAFIHIIKPHSPIVFAEDGTIIPPLYKDRDAFFAQLRFVNQQTLAMIDAILEKSDVPPIIIIQGDHGSHLGGAEPEDRSTYFEILNAFHWPGAAEGVIPPDITSVNTFRLLFNTYFGENYPMLENRHFEMAGAYDDIFRLVEVDIADFVPQN